MRNNKNLKNIKIFIIIILTSIFLYYLYYYFKFENFQNNDINVELVISRYNEDLEWLKEEPFNKFKVICYNKGNNDNFYKADNMEIIKLNNVGRESHTYLYHIIKNYNKLSDITVFLPGSTNLDHKKYKATRIIHEMLEKKDTIFLCTNHQENIKKTFYDFKLDEWVSTDQKNKTINPEGKLLESKIRPFGKWYENHFGNIDIYCISYNAILCINKKHIIQHPISYYEKFIKELETHSNPEVGHYIERVWNAIFYPLNDSNIINL